METTAIADPDYLKNTQNPLCAPTAKALADTIARQFEHPADAPLPAEILWKALQTTLARALNGIVVKQE
ncbi:MAG: hypothetical protein A2Z95_00730 [Gallionellales bacterium GWA2_60_18]|nr:MAG: hypothetical protein A2Z95_00730 [Gallionellales bacterium GWA2_60_18]